MVKNSILEELMNGNLSPEDNSFRNDPEYNRMVSRMQGLEKKFLDTLNDGEKKLYSEYSGIQDELNYQFIVSSFIRGFRLGMRMTIEVFAEE